MASAVAEKRTVDEEIAAIEATLAERAEELTGIPQRVSAALIEGDDQAYRELKDRQVSIPREQYSLRVRLLRLRIAERRAEHADVVASIGPLGDAVAPAELRLTEAQREASNARWAVEEAQDRKRELQLNIRRYEDELAVLLAEAGKVGR